MLTCKALAERYSQETNIPIPPNSASGDEKGVWLLTEQWGCLIPGVDGFVADQAECKSRLDVVPTDGNYKPYLNYLQQEGFLAWVNERGLKCVNGIMGNYYGLDQNTGSAKIPSVSVSQPESQCWGACWNVTTQSEMCFECINQVLTANPSMCPSIDVTNESDETLIRDAIACHNCISVKGTFVPTPDSSVTLDQAAQANNMWACITGTVSEGLSTIDIIVIVCVSIFVFALVLTLGLWFGVFKKRLEKQQEEAKQTGLGLFPEET
jgi:hypothetical protein